MTRVFAVILAVTFAAPAGALAGVSDGRADLIGPYDCCCPPEELDCETPPQFDVACCCELVAPTPGIDVHFSGIASNDASAWNVTLPLRIGVATPNPDPVIRVRSTAVARAPPLATLLSQHTSHLL